MLISRSLKLKSKVIFKFNRKKRRKKRKLKRTREINLAKKIKRRKTKTKTKEKAESLIRVQVNQRVRLVSLKRLEKEAQNDKKIICIPEEFMIMKVLSEKHKKRKNQRVLSNLKV